MVVEAVMLRKLLILAPLGVMASLLVVTPAQAAVPGPVTGQANKCVAGADSISASFCLAPSTVRTNFNNNQCPPFPNGQEWQVTTDLSNVGEYWTYPNGGTPCIKVSYSPSITYDNCDFYFYVPHGPLAKSSTSLVDFTYEDVQGGFHSASIDENPVDGWQLAFSSQIAIQSIYFTDANGRTGTSQEIAWGRDPDPNAQSHGIWEYCSTV
jgi:hypothetical protein